MPVVVFYLVLRALDTIEDDTTLDVEEKEPLLRRFYTHIDDKNWTFDGSGPDEKDREVLVKFDTVAREFNQLKDEYKDIIRDITLKMGDGMADYAKKANEDPSGISVKTIKDYELYCHYVAGLVGEGLTRLFVQANFVKPSLLRNTDLMESMGQLLQQTNIIRDVREDHDSKRHFWPSEIWSKHVEIFNDLFLPQNKQKALQCSTEMILLALNRAPQSLLYMSQVTNQPTFNFVSIPQTMALATLELCFRNPALFERNIKISKGAACQIMLESTRDFRGVCEVFRRYARRIRRRNDSRDLLYWDIDVACENIERSVEEFFPGEEMREAERRRNGVIYFSIAVFGFIIAAMVGHSHQMLYQNQV